MSNQLVRAAKENTDEDRLQHILWQTITISISVGVEFVAPASICPGHNFTMVHFTKKR